MQALALRPDGIYVDGTFGRGGHAAPSWRAWAPPAACSPSTGTPRR